MSIRLSRRTASLLGTVNGVARDQYNARKQDAKSNTWREDYNSEDNERSPESSGTEDNESSKTAFTPGSAKRASGNDRSVNHHGVDARRDTERSSATCNRRSARNAISTASNSFVEVADRPPPSKKRKSDASTAVVLDDDSDERIFSQSSQPTRRSKTYGMGRSRPRHTENIHTSSQQKQSRPASSRDDTKKFHTPRYTGLNDAQERKRPDFKLPTNPLNEESAPNKANLSSFIKPPGKIEDYSNPSSSLLSQQLPKSSTDPDGASSLSSPPESVLSEEDDDPLPPPSDPTKDRCPTCKQEVDRTLLDDFSLDNPLRWRDKLNFCNLHKQRTAQQDWIHQKYPKIEWSTFDRRLRRFRGDMDALIELKRESYFRRRLEEKVASGKNRNAFRNPEAAGQETTVPGYYGQKGAHMMQDHIVAAFSDKMRKLAATDPLIPATGVAGYVQAVLVPELAVLLIREDLGVGVEKAREVLMESAEMGDLLNPQDEETVQDRGEDEARVIDLS